MSKNQQIDVKLFLENMKDLPPDLKEKLSSFLSKISERQKNHVQLPKTPISPDP